MTACSSVSFFTNTSLVKFGGSLIVELAARKPLRDAKWALKRLEETEDLREFRVIWAATVALLRAVGHVLEKVDARDPRLKSAVDSAWSDWKQNSRRHRI